MSEIDNLNKEIKDLKENVDKLINVGGINLPDFFLTDRQIVKKMMLLNQTPPVSEEDAHMVVYGKLLYDGNKLVDNEVLHPECVDPDRAMDINHTIIKDSVYDMKNKVKNSFNTLKDKVKELKDDLKNLSLKSVFVSAELAVTAVPIVGTATIPSAISSIFTLLYTINTIVHKISSLVPILDEFKYLDYVMDLSRSDITTVLQPITILLSTINSILEGINPIYIAIGVLTVTMNKIIGDSDKKMEKMKEKAKKDIDKDDLTDDEKEQQKKELDEQFALMKTEMNNAITKLNEEYKIATAETSDIS